MKFRSAMVMFVSVALCLTGIDAHGEETYFVLPASQATRNEWDVYVSENGDDQWNGTFEAPLRTFRAALSRALRMETANPVTIWLRGGTYVIDETLVAAQSSHMQSSQLTIRAYGNEKPVLTGGVALGGWTETTLNGSAVWSVPYGGGALRALYGEDGARQPCRWPKRGMFWVSEAYGQAESKLTGSLAFFANKNDMPPMLEGAVVRLLHWWKDELIGVKAYNPNTGMVMLNRATALTVMKDDRFWLENVSGVPLAPGEWLLDPQNQLLYYAPLPDEAPDRTTLYAGAVEQLLVIRGLSDIEFKGVTFARTGWVLPNGDAYRDVSQAAYDAGAAIFVTGSRNIRFSNCTFRDIGAACIRFDFAVKDAVVTGCTFENIGSQAVYVHGQNQPMDPTVTEGIVVENNHINGYGRNFLNAAAVLIIHARGVSVLHNEIHGGTYTAISAGWVWGEAYNVTDSIRIENNLLYSIGQGRLSDMGAIYLLGKQPNTVVSGNIIHDVVSASYGGWGIYLDEGASGILVMNNLVYRCSDQGFHQNCGGTNTVINNIFAFNRDGQIGISGKGSFYLDKNIIVGDKPHLRTSKEGDIKLGQNVFRTDGSLFVDAANDNFNLAYDPEVSKIGFAPWIFFAGRYTAIQESIFTAVF